MDSVKPKISKKELAKYMLTDTAYKLTGAASMGAGFAILLANSDSVGEAKYYLGIPFVVAGGLILSYSMNESHKTDDAMKSYLDKK